MFRYIPSVIFSAASSRGRTLLTKWFHLGNWPCIPLLQCLHFVCRPVLIRIFSNWVLFFFFNSLLPLQVFPSLVDLKSINVKNRKNTRSVEWFHVCFYCSFLSSSHLLPDFLRVQIYSASNNLLFIELHENVTVLEKCKSITPCTQNCRGYDWGRLSLSSIYLFETS